MFKRKVDRIMLVTNEYAIVRGFDELFSRFGKSNNWDNIIFDPEIDKWKIYYSIEYRTKIGRLVIHETMKKFVTDIANGERL